MFELPKNNDLWASPDCPGCSGGDKVKYWCCPVSDAEWQSEDPAHDVYNECLDLELWD